MCILSHSLTTRVLFSYTIGIVRSIELGAGPLTNKKDGLYVSRRDFLKLSGLGIVSLLIPESVDKLVVQDQDAEVLLRGTDVYDLSELGYGQVEIDKVVDSFDEIFDANLPWYDLPDSLWEQREKYMSKNERYMQVVVKKSVFESYKSRKSETGVDFVEYMNLMIDSMNRELQQYNPPIYLKNILKRIIIVDDAYDSNPVRYSKDIDAMWFFDADNRQNQDNGSVGQGSFWSVKEIIGGGVVLCNPAGSTYGREITLKGSGDSFDFVEEGVWIDYGQVHEFKHQLWNIPDEYNFNFEGVNSVYKNFRFDNGYFMEPSISPYIAMLIRRSVELGVRGYYMDDDGIGTARSMLEKYSFFGELPMSAKISVSGAQAIGVSRSRAVIPDYFDNKERGVLCKRMEKLRELKGDDFSLSAMDFAPDILDGEGIYPVLFRIDTVRAGLPDELYIPLAVFNMSKMAGLDTPEYVIEYAGVEPPLGFGSQVMKLVESVNLEDFETENIVYAKMKVDGTSCWAVWIFQY